MSESLPVPSCPDPGLLAGFVEDRLLPRERAEVEAHLVRCEDCRAAALAVPRAPRIRILRPWMAAVPIAAALLLFFWPGDPVPSRGTGQTLVAAAR
jgi:hypothetical protein